MGLQQLLASQKKYLEKHPKLSFLLPAFSALDHFLYEPPYLTKQGPHIRDAIDLKRWMVLVIIALLPCIFMAIWNTGLQKFVYASGNPSLVEEYLQSSKTLSGYFSFSFQDGRYLHFLKEGSLIFFPIMLISYVVGGFWEVLFACIRKHEIAEELADVLNWVLILSHDLGIDIVEATHKKIDKNDQKYPVERARGNHDKYTAYQQDE